MLLKKANEVLVNLLESLDIFKDYLVLSERTNGLNQIRIKRWDNTEDYYLPFTSETYTCYTGTNVDFDTEILLPYKQSNFGPYFSKGDVNGDGLLDVVASVAVHANGYRSCKISQLDSNISVVVVSAVSVFLC